MRKFVLLLLAVITVFALWTGGWFYAAGEARRQLQQLAANDGQSGPNLRCGSFAVTGFPFRFDFDCTAATLVMADTTLTLAGLRASVLAYNPTHVIFSAAPPLTLADAFSGSRSRVDFSALQGSLRLTTADLLASFGGEGWRLARASLVADSVASYNDLADASADGVPQAGADLLEAHLVDLPEAHDPAAGTASLAAFAEVQGLSIAGSAVTATNATLEATASGLPDDLRRFAEPGLLRRWQAAGGQLQVTKLSGTQDQPELAFEVAGEASLTDAGLLDADLRYRTRGVFEQFSGLIPPWQLPLLQGEPDAEGYHANTIRIDDGRIRLLTFTLLSVPSLFGFE